MEQALSVGADPLPQSEIAHGEDAAAIHPAALD